MNRRSLRRMILQEMYRLNEEESMYPGHDALALMLDKAGIKFERPSPQTILINIGGEVLEVSMHQ